MPVIIMPPPPPAIVTNLGSTINFLQYNLTPANMGINGLIKSVAHGIADISKIVGHVGVANSSDGYYSIPFSGAYNDLTCVFQCYIEGANLNLRGNGAGFITNPEWAAATVQVIVFLGP